MPHTLFISDLHLAAERPQINTQFFDFIENIAPAAEALYILGDLFEYWAGDDDLNDPLNAAVAQALSTLACKNVLMYFMQGNRDLLLGEHYAARCGMQIIADPTVIDLYGSRTLLMHGDTLCTDDIEYQKFRTYARNPATQQRFLAQPLAARHQQLRGMRMQSEASKSVKSMDIMDVSSATVEQALRAHGHPRLIHGHTHRPAKHLHHVDGRNCERWVLSDWQSKAHYLRCDEQACTAI